MIFISSQSNGNQTLHSCLKSVSSVLSVGSIGRESEVILAAGEDPDVVYGCFW